MPRATPLGTSSDRTGRVRYVVPAVSAAGAGAALAHVPTHDDTDGVKSYFAGTVLVRPAEGCVLSERTVVHASGMPAAAQAAADRTFPRADSGCDETTCNGSELFTRFSRQSGPSVNRMCLFLLRQSEPLQLSWNLYRKVSRVGVVEVMTQYLHERSWRSASASGVLTLNTTIRVASGSGAMSSELKLSVSLEKPKLFAKDSRNRGDGGYRFGLVEFGLVDVADRETRTITVRNPTSHPVAVRLAPQEFEDGAFESLCRSMDGPMHQLSSQDTGGDDQNASACRFGHWGPRPRGIADRESFQPTQVSESGREVSSSSSAEQDSSPLSSGESFSSGNS